MEEEQIYIIVLVGLETGLQQRDRNNTFSLSSRHLPASRVLVLLPCVSVPWSGLLLLFAQFGVSSSGLIILRYILGNQWDKVGELVYRASTKWCHNCLAIVA